MMQFNAMMRTCVQRIEPTLVRGAHFRGLFQWRAATVRVN